jgi:integrase
MPTKNLNYRTVLNLKPKSTRVDYFDESLPGFGLRVTSSGIKTWFYVYRIDNRLRRWTIGTYPKFSLAEAREKAEGGRDDVKKGIDPAEQKIEAREADTFAELADDFLKRYRKKNGAEKISRDEDERIITAELLPHWQHKKAAAITRRDVKALAQAIADRPAPVQANRVVALVSTIFNFAVDEDLLDTNPAYRIKKLGAEHTRDRVLTDDEIRSLWTVLEKEDAVYQAFYKFALVTGQRMGGKRKDRGEILWMRWSEIDEPTHWWSIPGERTKNGKAQRVFLTPMARASLKAMRDYQQEKKIVSEFVFTTPRSKTQPVTGAKHIVKRIREKTKTLSESGEALDFRPHDLRRTVATLMAKNGVSHEIVKKVLNHTDRDVTSIYDRHSYDTEKRRAWERWESVLKRILEAKKGAVLPMPARAS